MVRWLVWCFLVVGGCKDEPVVDCVASCVECGPANPCPAGFICDPIIMRCEKIGVVPDAGPAIDASHD